MDFSPTYLVDANTQSNLRKQSMVERGRCNPKEITTVIEKKFGIQNRMDYDEVSVTKSLVTK